MNFKFPEITIYDKYIFKQVTMASLVAVLLFTIVWIAPEMLLNTIKGALSGEYGFKTAILILVCDLPKILNSTFPGGLLLGVLFTFDKLSKDSEMTIFRAVGMSFSRIIAPVIVLSLFFTVVCFVLSDKGTPLAAAKMQAIQGTVKSTQYIYTQKDSTGHPLMSVVVSKSMNRKLQNVIVLDFSSDVYQDVHQLSGIYSAKTGYADKDKWTLEDITSYKISNDGIYIDIGHLNKMNILNGQAATNAYTLMTYSTMKERDITNKDLGNYVRLLKKEKMTEEYNYNLNKYLQRFLRPFICVLLAILGALLGFSKPREQRLIGFTIGIGCIFLYYITLPCFDVLAEKGVLSPYVTALFPILALIVAIREFYKAKDL